MSLYHVKIYSLYFHIMKGSLLKGKLISSLPLRLRKHKMYDLKNPFPQIGGIVGSRAHCFFVYITMRGEYWFKIDIHLGCC